MLGRCRILLGWMIGLSAGVCAAQQPDASIQEALASLAQRAGTIFAGEVTAVRPGSGIVEIDFRVDQALKAAGGSYTLREWSGLWAAGQRRYWLGERVLIFLHPASASGLSTPVDGMDGVLPMSAASDGAAYAVDVRRLATRLQREPGQPAPDASATLALETATAIVAAQLPVTARPVLPVNPRPTPPVLLTPVKRPKGVMRQLNAPQ